MEGVLKKEARSGVRGKEHRRKERWRRREGGREASIDRPSSAVVWTGLYSYSTAVDH